MRVILPLALIVAFAGQFAHASEPTGNKATAARILLEKMGKGDFSKLDEIYGPGFVAHAGQTSFTLDEDNESGRRLRSMFPGMHVTVDRIIGEGDFVALHWRATAPYRHTSGEKPGKPMSVDGMSFFRFSNGRVVEEWSVTDQLGMMRQMAALQGK